MPRYVEFIKSANLTPGEVTPHRSTASFVGGYLALSGSDDLTVVMEGAVGEGKDFAPTEQDWIPVQEATRFERIAMVPTLTRLRVLTGTMTRAIAEYYDDVNLAPKETIKFDTSDPLARAALSNTTLAQLSAKSSSAGSQFVDSSRWLWKETGTANGVTVLAAAGGGFWVRDYVGVVSSAWFGFRTGTDGDAAAIAANNAAWVKLEAFVVAARRTDIPDLTYGGAQVMFEAGRFPYTYTPTITANISITGQLDRGTIFSYLGADYMMVFAGRTLEPYTDAASQETISSLKLSQLTFIAPTGGGILLGSRIQPSILFDHLDFYKVGTASLPVVNMGEAVYFLTMDSCRMSECAGVGVLQRPYCDRLRLINCSFGNSSAYYLDLRGPTFEIEHNNFEANSSDLASIVLRTSDVTSGYGSLSHNRFGPEEPALRHAARTVAPFDIAIIRDGNVTERVMNGVNIETNKHFSRDSGPQRKTSPMYIDTGLSRVLIERYLSVNYITSFFVNTGNAAQVQTYSAKDGSVSIDRLEDLHPDLRGVFTPRLTSSRVRIRVRLDPGAPAIAAGRVLVVTGYDGAWGCPVVAGSGAPTLAAHYIGVSESAIAPGDYFWMDTLGSTLILASVASVPTGAPIYVSDAGGLTGTAPTVVRRVATSAGGGALTLQAGA